MPLFFFDIYDGESVVRDAYGIELDSIEEAAEQAAALLPDLARGASPDRDSRDFATLVRDDSDAVVYRAALLYRGLRSAGRDVRTVPGLPETHELILRSRETRAAAERVSARLRAEVADLLTVIEAVSHGSTQVRAEREARS